MKNIIIGVIVSLTIASANQLANEQSPYLLQHKNNPVAWMPWNKETLQKAKKENKLIFLSIGYSTCHWCHVMEEESFEKEDVAKAVNKDYIAIKVDREEMPQIDSYYQNIYQVMNGRGGGWPLTIIMTPDAKPFWSATYLPKNDLLRILAEISEVYVSKKEEIIQVTKDLNAVMQKLDKQKSRSGNSDLNQTILTFTESVRSGFDEMSGGFGTAPKFPRATLIEAILDLYSINKNKELLRIAETTLKGMADGGIYDQIESGFYRYSVDGQWHIPHFEKMLYSQAEMLRVYSKAYLLTGKERYKKIVDDLTRFINKRFDKEYLLYSASDADSLAPNGKKEEGYYFVFAYNETLDFLKAKGYSKTEANAILGYFNISKNGNFEHNSTNPNIQTSKPIANLEKVKEDLTELRSKKPYPFVDNKILASWNSMYISALVQASKIDKKYGDEALNRLDTLLKSMIIDGKLYHQKLHGKKLKVLGLLEDYAFLVDALTDVYQLNYDRKYIDLAHQLAKESINKFYDQGNWNLSDDAYRTKSSLYDSAYASPASVITRALFKVALLTDDLKIYEIAKKSISQNPDLMQQYPDSIATAFSTFVGYKTEYKVLKSAKNELIKNRSKIEELKHPYLLTKAIELDKPLYLGCEIKLCFVTDKDLDKVLKSIESRK
ncbi:MAG: thioredoxin domain-containing protein [Sulfurovum sp.]|nr:thioredoxin domain-containing protein [Sulfurovum sp.]